MRFEFFRQREFLERTIEDVKHNIELLNSKTELHFLAMDENMKLIEEINKLRKEAKMFFTKYNNLKALLSVNVKPIENDENNST